MSSSRNESNSVKVIGWIGSFCFAVSAIPQAYDCWMRGNADGISNLFLFLWFVGEICTLFYVVSDNRRTGEFMWPLILNYIVNLMFLLVIIYYKLIHLV